MEKAAWINLTGTDQEVKDNLSALPKKYRAKGYTRAADNLDHFLNGKKARVTISRDDARKDPFVRNAESENRDRFETSTFLGTSGNGDNNRELRSLQEGETIRLNDHWDVQKGKAGLMFDAAFHGKAGMDDILADGERNFRSTADFTATRQGNTILIRGSVEHDGSEKYDFETGGLGHLMGAKGLAKAGLADNFDINRKWNQIFNGTVEIVQTPEGPELANPRFKWSDMPPKRPKR